MFLTRPGICPWIFMGDVIEKVKAFAGEAHAGQIRKYTPEPYIVHPIRVMELCARYTLATPVLSAALLHDVLEDTEVSEKKLHRFLHSVMIEEEAKKTLELVVDLTDVYVKAKYPHWNRIKRKRMEAQRIAQTSADAQTIKYADIIDNCTEIILYDDEFGPRFLFECKMLLERINKGHSQLYRQAKEVVDQGLAKYKTPEK